MNGSNGANSPHIVLICLDSLRKDYYDDNAPRLRELADVSFEEMRAMSSWSVPSHAAMFTGRLPRETGVHSHDRDMSKIREQTWLTELNTYRTLGVSANIYASPVFGFDALFDDFVSVSRSRWFSEGMDVQEHINSSEKNGIENYISFIRTAISHDHPLKSVLNGIVLKTDDFIQSTPVRKPLDFGAKAIVHETENKLINATDPVFAFVNIMDTHTPHTPFRGISRGTSSCPGNFSTDSYSTWDVNAADGIKGYENEVGWFRELYAATVSYVDQIVAKFIQRVQQATDRETVFIITADHGENLGYEDDGFLMHHSSSLSEGLLHVPFDVIGTKATTKSIGELASHQSLGEIVSALSQRKSIERFTTSRAEAEIIGPSSEGFPESERNIWTRAMHAVYKNSHKYVRDELTTEECWDVSGPPCQQRKTDDPIPSDIFGISFEDWIDAVETTRTDKSDPEISASAEARLREFGYL